MKRYYKVVDFPIKPDNDNDLCEAKRCFGKIDISTRFCNRCGGYKQNAVNGKA